MSTFIIAEAGVNHNGSMDMAKDLIHAARDAGADAVKFQSFRASHLVSKTAPKADYQKENTGTTESQFEMLKKLELSPEDHHLLIEECRKCKIDFLSTPFDTEGAKILVRDYGLKKLKIPSGEITNAPMLFEVGRLGVPVILSTGMSTLEDIRQALGVYALGVEGDSAKLKSADFDMVWDNAKSQGLLKDKISLLHCTTEYPTPYSDVNLRAMDLMRREFELEIGLSDHSAGIMVPVAAVARGATIIEKHFTMDRSLPGPDHKASLEPKELIAMVEAIRATEQALGKEQKEPAPSEKKNMAIARKSLVAARAITKGELFNEENLTIKRPGDGVSPFRYWDLLGRSADRDYAEEELIQCE